MRLGLFAFVLLALCSCEFVTEVDVPAIDPRIVVNALFRPDSSWSITVSQNRHILAVERLPPPANAIASIADESGTILTLTPIYSANQVLRFESTSAPVAGQLYTIRISAPGFQEVTASAVAPKRVELLEVHLDSSKMIPHNDYTAGSIPIEFTFQDPPGQKDYYIPKLMVAREYREYKPDRTYVTRIHWEDTWLSQIPSGSGLTEAEQPIRFIEDAGFDGKLHTIRLHVNRSGYSSNDPDTFPWRFQFTHIGEDYHKYARSFDLQQESNGNPLAQPVQVFTNVEGGLGIFAGLSTSTWSHD